MIDLYWVYGLDGWDHEEQEPRAGFTLLASVESPREASLQAEARWPIATIDKGPGMVVCIDRELTKLTGGNVRVDPWLMLAEEDVLCRQRLMG